MHPLGYVVMQHSMRDSRPVKAYQKWMDRIPNVYRSSVLDRPDDESNHCLALLKHYRSLMSMAMEAGKPMFDLKPADGAIGAHFEAVRDCGRDFEQLAKAIAARAGIDLNAPAEQ